MLSYLYVFYLDWFKTEQLCIEQAVVTFSSIKNSDEVQDKYRPEIGEFIRNEGNKGRRQSTWATKSIREASDFVSALYAHEASPWYHGFNSEHARVLLIFFQSKRYNKMRAYEKWDVEARDYPNLDSSTGASDDLDIDFRLPAYKECGPVLPGKDKFAPVDTTINVPPTFSFFEKQKPVKPVLLSMLDISRNMMRSVSNNNKTHTTINTTPVSTAFVFVKGTAACPVMTKTSGVTWKQFVMDTWRQNINFKVFPYHDNDLDAIENKTKELWFTMPGLGKQRMCYLRDMTIDVIVAQVPKKQRPIEVIVDLHDVNHEVDNAARKTARLDSFNL